MLEAEAPSTGKRKIKIGLAVHSKQILLRCQEEEEARPDHLMTRPPYGQTTIETAWHRRGSSYILLGPFPRVLAALVYRRLSLPTTGPQTCDFPPPPAAILNVDLRTNRPYI